MPKFISTNYPGVVYYQSQKRKDRTFYAKIKNKGKIEWIKLGRSSEGMNPLKASQLRGIKLQELRHGKIITKMNVLTVQQAIDEFLAVLKVKLVPKEYSERLRQFKRFTDFIAPSLPISEIKQKDAEAMILHLRVTTLLPSTKYHKGQEGKFLSSSTIIHHYDVYKQMFKHLINTEKYFGTNPFTTEVFKLIPKVNNELVRYFTNEENLQFAESLFREYKDNKTEEFIRNFLGILFSTGFRRGEAAKLEERDIDFERQIVCLRNPKSGKDKYVEISDIAIYFINSQIAAKKKYKVTSKFIFCSRSGALRTEFSSQWVRFKRLAGLPEDFRVHDLRHNFATLVASAGNDIYVIQKLLTHSNPTITQRYAHLVKGRMTNAANDALQGIKFPIDINR
jgi:site-specific recombinase XerD